MTEPTDEEKAAYEERLRARLEILKEQLEAGKIKIAKDLKVVDSLAAVRYLPDGKVDLDTVDGLVRSLALTVEHFHTREELKKAASLADIQKSYFRLLEQNFKHFYEHMLEHRVTPHQVAERVSRDEKAVKELIAPLPEFLGFLHEFWDAAGDSAQVHLEDMHDVLKGVFGGDLFPASSENLASKCGLYTDTLVLPCPFMRSSRLFKLWEPRQQAYYLVKHALNLLQYRDLACADVTPPIVVVIAHRASRDEEEAKFFLGLGEGDALVHAGRIFGRHFESQEDLRAFCDPLDTADSVVAQVKDGKRVLFDLAWEGDVKAHILRATKDQHAQLLKTAHPGVIVATQAVGRMSVANELLYTAQQLGGVPIIDAPTSWQYFVWKLEYDAAKVEKETALEHLHVVRGLQTLSENEMEWLGRVPLEALLEVRKENAMGEIRQILGKGVLEIATANPANFHRTADKVFDNIHGAFDQHQKNIKELTAKGWKFAGSEVGSWVVVGSLAAAAAATAGVGLAMAAWAADKTLDPAKPQDILKKMREQAKERQEAKRSPVGMMFKYSKAKPA